MKPPLVLLSGLLSNKTLWQHQVRHLSDVASIQVISPSQDTPKKMIQAILDKAPSKFALAGHSMGGWLCLEIMRAAPSRVSRLCLLNTTAREDSEEKRLARQQMILKAENGQFPEVVKELVEKLVFNPLVKKEVEKMFLEVGQEAFIHQEKAMLARNECQSILPTIKCPVLVIHAAEDKNFALEEHEELVDQIPHAKLAIIEKSGHMSPMEAPQVVTELLRSWICLKD
jgi:pimeloyl-ACP methyl ester carboxylesterase